MGTGGRGAVEINMASGGKRSASDRVLESKHVIGLFLLMLLFSGVFFSLGYVMGRNQYDGQVRAANSMAGRPDVDVAPKAGPASAPKKSAELSGASGEADPVTADSKSDWGFYDSNKPAKSQPRLDAVPKAAAVTPTAKALSGKTSAQPQPVLAPAKSKSVTAVPSGAYVIQVAAFLKLDDALVVANSLQKKHYVCYVQPPQKDKYYRVQVGPFKDRKASDAAKLGLENEGFKAFYVKH
jgi:septal ring-binding cell division protein DamX